MIYFTSDLHFGHKNIIEYCNRPFDDVEEMNAALINNWNETVSDNDTVYILGDLFMGKRDTWAGIVEQLNGHIRLVPGNHDQCHPMRSKSKKFTSVFEEMGIEVMSDKLILPEDERFYLCHFPFEGDSQEVDRFDECRPDRMEVGDKILLHGHIHEKWRINNPTTFWGKTLNVGVDVNKFRPISLEEICQEFDIPFHGPH